MEQKDIEFFKNLLNDMLQEALKQSDSTIEDMTDSNELCADPADRATVESDRAFTLRIRDRERKLIKKINSALARIEDGSYGVCDDCGEEIGVPRLKARPVTKLCINCKAKQEEDEQLRGD
ncbi:RNA polymerase-binding protein DksA [Desulfovibrio sp. OttesenSCG-928-C06]|nr:RNA polymerase-binding protein DksA [Desulfovibrio sp. OttesenSCG-928-C06]